MTVSVVTTHTESIRRSFTRSDITRIGSKLQPLQRDRLNDVFVYTVRLQTTFSTDTYKLSEAKVRLTDWSLASEKLKA